MNSRSTELGAENRLVRCPPMIKTRERVQNLGKN
jgi:hypothetical protein